jgi:DNA-binding NtrC family response regulator
METILIADDNIDTMENIAEICEDHGYQTYLASDGVAALEIIKKQNPDCVLLDMKMPKMDGWDVLGNIQREIDSGMIVIMITAYGQVAKAVQAIKRGAYDFIEKPFNNEILLLTIERGLSSQRVRKELRKLKDSLQQNIDGTKLFGKSKAIQKVIKQIDIVAPTDMTILIQGETGTGKEVLAQYIHRQSQRCNLPFIALDCGAIPETLIESELFGHEKGSFTGAYRRNTGKFEAAHRGTLFLDEIGNLPIQHQRRLLRVVEQNKVLPIGANEPITVDVRMIVASNKRLDKLVNNGQFREDLFYRISEFVITMPPLRERCEDIPHFISTFMSEANEELNRHVQGITETALEKLLNYHWPGNLRQLKNTIRKAVLLATDKITPENLSITELDTPSSLPNLDFNLHDNFKAALEDYYLRIEKEVIQKAIQKANGNLTQAAKIFGIDRTTLYAKMAKHNINQKQNSSDK